MPSPQNLNGLGKSQSELLEIVFSMEHHNDLQSHGTILGVVMSWVSRQLLENLDQRLDKKEYNKVE